MEFDEELTDYEYAMQLNVYEDDVVSMKMWCLILRLLTTLLCLLLFIIGFTNLVLSNSFAQLIIYTYVLLSSTLMCCYEMALRNVSPFISINFGFLYSVTARIIFLLLISITCLSMTLFGTILSAFSLIIALVYGYVGWSYPKYEVYIRRMHARDDSSQNAYLPMSVFPSSNSSSDNI